VANERASKRYESVFTKKVRAGKRRTYFFDVRRTKGDDYYLTVTESSQRVGGNGYDRHKIFIYKEDFNRFARTLEEMLALVKHELMPHYDYDEFERRQEEYAKRLEQDAKTSKQADDDFIDDDEDMSW
jgi:hypothetical protein